MYKSHVLFTRNYNCSWITVLWNDSITHRKICILDGAAATPRISWLDWVVNISSMDRRFCPGCVTWFRLMLWTMQAVRRSVILRRLRMRARIDLWWRITMLWDYAIVLRVLRRYIVWLAWMTTVIPIIVLCELLWSLVHCIGYELSVWWVT